jgi:hypothetical protein
MFALIIPLTGDGTQLPDHSLPPGWASGGRPNRPGHDLPGGGGRPDNSLPDEGGPDHVWWGGRRPPRPGHDLPEGPSPKAMHQAVPESSIPSHPPKPDPDKPGEWLLVAMGDGSVAWAWTETAEPPQPK